MVVSDFRTRGFSLIELLIVVAIILIVAAIAIPNLLRARIAANQASGLSEPQNHHLRCYHLFVYI